MKISEILKTKVPFSLALLFIMVLALGTEQLFLQAMEVNQKTYNSIAAASLAPRPNHLNSWLGKTIKEKVALSNANVPLIPGAERMTFDNAYAVRYRVDASANSIANFYRQVLAYQGWKITRQASTNNLDKLTITFAENALSKKTNITYNYIPVNASQVLGVKIAEADTGVPAPTEQLPLEQPQPPMQPQQPNQPNQPNPNQMDFSRQPDNNQNNQQNQPWADMCSNNTALACVDGTGKFIASAKVGLDGKPVCPADSTAECGNYQQNNQQGPNNQSGQMGQPGQQGPSDEQIKQMDEQRFKDMKRGLSQFSNGAKMMKRSVTRMKTANSKCGVGMPEELDNALAQTDSLIEKINAAKTADDLDTIVGDIQDVGSVMQDWGPRMGDLSRLCQTLKQADRDAKQFDRSIKQIESQAKINKKVDLSELITEYKTAVSAQKDSLAQAKELAKTDPESAQAKIEDDFYGNMDNLGNLQMQISTILNVSKGIRDITRELTNYASQIKALTKKKIDTADLQIMLDNLKAQIAEIKTLVTGKIDAEELAGKIDEAFTTRQDLQDALQENGMINLMPQTNAGNNYNVKMNLPNSFIKNTNNNVNLGDQGLNSGPNSPGLNAPTGLGL